MSQVIITAFITGLGILLVALVLNWLAGHLGLSTWYDFVKEPGSANLLSYVWLFAIYPFCLGLTAYALLKLFTEK